MLEIIQCGFHEPAFQDCLSIRLEVFVHEQNVPAAEEADEHDATALHFLARQDGVAAGTARVIFNEPEIAKITRVAVRKSFRSLRIGEALMQHIENHLKAREFTLDAQTQALRFYQNLGYEAFGEEFMEAGIPHHRMRRNPS